MQIFTTAVLLSGLTSLVAGAAFGPPGFQFPKPPAPKTTAKATTTAHYATTSAYYTTTSAYSTTTSAAAVPTVSCLTNSTAAYLVNGYASLLTAYNNDTANAILASDFSDWSDSINYLAGYALGTATFPSKSAFEQGQGSQPAIGFSVSSINFWCTGVAFRWIATLGQYPVSGINVLYASNLNGTSAGWQIETMYAEFNVGAWELDIGQACGAYSPGDTIG